MVYRNIFNKTKKKISMYSIHDILESNSERIKELTGYPITKISPLCYISQEGSIVDIPCQVYSNGIREDIGTIILNLKKGTVEYHENKVKK